MFSRIKEEIQIQSRNIFYYTIFFDRHTHCSRFLDYLSTAVDEYSFFSAVSVERLTAINVVSTWKNTSYYKIRERENRPPTRRLSRDAIDLQHVNILRWSSPAKEDERIQKRDSTGWIPRWLIRWGGSLTSRRECMECLTPITRALWD